MCIHTHADEMNSSFFPLTLVVLGLRRVEADVLEEHDLPVGEAVGDLGDLVAHAVRRHLALLVQELAQPLGDGRKGELVLRAVLRSPKVRGQRDSCAC